MRETASSMLLKAGTGVLTLAIAFVIGAGHIAAQESLEDDVTYARDVTDWQFTNGKLANGANWATPSAPATTWTRSAMVTPGA